MLGKMVEQISIAADTNRMHTADKFLLEAVRDLCPPKEGDRCEIEALGKRVVLTFALRQKIEAELKRRKQSKK
jgi:hypothetical protein